MGGIQWLQTAGTWSESNLQDSTNLSVTDMWWQHRQQKNAVEILEEQLKNAEKANRVIMTI